MNADQLETAACELHEAFAALNSALLRHGALLPAGARADLERASATVLSEAHAAQRRATQARKAGAVRAEADPHGFARFFRLRKLALLMEPQGVRKKDD